jgi:hypothetical protein
MITKINEFRHNKQTAINEDANPRYTGFLVTGEPLEYVKNAITIDTYYGTPINAVYTIKQTEAGVEIWTTDKSSYDKIYDALDHAEIECTFLPLLHVTNEGVSGTNKGGKMFQSYSTKNKSTGWVTIDLGEDSLGDPSIEFSVLNGGGMKKPEVVEIIKYLNELLPKLTDPR